MALVIASCSDTKEDKFISDVEGFVEKLEAITPSEIETNASALDQMVEDFTKRMKDEYEVDLNSYDLTEVSSKTDMQFSDEQKDKLKELNTRIQKKISELQNAANSSEDSDLGDSLTDGFDESSEQSDDSSLSESSDSEDWDELLDSYESYVDKYITYVKKASNGDMSALAEYPSLMEKAQELSDKLEKAKGQMSTSQLNRYTKIQSKMMRAAQELGK